MRERESVGVRRSGWDRSPAALFAILALVTGLALAGSSRAAETAFQFEASLVPGTCGFDCLGALGGSVTGAWLFESTAGGSGANPNVYPLISIDFETFMGVVGGGTFGTISIANDVGVPGADAYTVGVGGEFGSVATLTLTDLSVQLIDEDGTVFSDTSLPETAPPLPPFESAFVFMTWSDGSLTTWAPVWEITSLSSTIVSGGDCCSVHAAPGCDDAVCEADVCAIDASCCISGWDETCRSLALSTCAVCGSGVCPGVGSGPISPLDEMTPTAPPFSEGGNPNQMRGWRFTATVPGLIVTRLGVNTLVSDTVSHTVTLFDYATQAVLAQVGSPIGPDWQWAEIPPVPLVEGRDYVVQAHSKVDDWYYFGTTSSLDASWFPSGPIEYVQTLFRNGVTDPSLFPNEALNNTQYGVVDIGYAFTSCFDLPAPTSGSIVDPAFGPPGRSFDFFVNEPGIIHDLDVGVRLYANGGSPGSATWWDDFKISLRKGSRVYRLNDNPTTSVNGLFDVVFDGDATTSIQIAKVAPGDAVGPYRPDGPVGEPMDGVMIGGPWTLNFESVPGGQLNETRIEGWELVGDVYDEQTLVRCEDPGESGGDNASSRGIRFHVDRSFQGVRLDLSARAAGAYRFDVELRRSTGFTAPVERTTTMETDLLDGIDTSVPIYFGDVPVQGLESFTMKFTNISGPDTMFFDVYGGGLTPCPNVEETSQNTGSTPTVRGDPRNFSVIAVPETGIVLGVAGGALVLGGVARRRGKRLRGEAAARSNGLARRPSTP